jgi:uncharacterized phage-associated protein
MVRILKLSQMAAYFLRRADGGSMNHFKLMKLMYLADRRSFETDRLSISDDKYCSMKRGPVLEKALALFHGWADPKEQDQWNSWISKKENGRLRLIRDVKDGDFNMLTNQELEIMGKVHDCFGSWDWLDLVEYSHSLKEWENPGEKADKRDSKPLPVDKILEALRIAPETDPFMTEEDEEKLEKKPLTNEEIKSTAYYLNEVEPNIKPVLSIQDFKNRKRPDSKVYADALETILDV